MKYIVMLMLLLSNCATQKHAIVPCKRIQKIQKCTDDQLHRNVFIIDAKPMNENNIYDVIYEDNNHIDDTEEK